VYEYRSQGRKGKSWEPTLEAGIKVVGAVEVKIISHLCLGLGNEISSRFDWDVYFLDSLTILYFNSYSLRIPNSKTNDSTGNRQPKQ
jgi:hypothetical protein